ncbi:hypothetical protein [Natranaeroarchaeum sulfidigenes]|uniref:Peptidoglycan/xylan/chitin deacetylase, PgdA/CDA1 family n=1 Tax=Natranaeroarchaeum sulfidigenes TaxID=2784880 RepID=A0A897MY13_9EURY|nr:hypothetical protein [Natranaeroarchaeum sulfidigenes]QSG03026.1 Peptidoglycan/xylan/chitin deacetylase, PgdA/CDA1 family [Natranaeroarchaeum sulfidigenes]
MPSDFTFEIYADLLDAGLEAGYEFITVREYLASDPLPQQFVILRHDVDRKAENALDMARLEADHGVSSTYYFRTIEKTFRPEMIRTIERLGHEIGYHYEDMDRTDGDVGAAHDSFETELARLREHATVDTVCMHGNPLTDTDNRDMWDHSATSDDQFAAYGLLGEAYLSMDFEDVTYFSDTGRTWRDGDLKIKDHTMGEGDKEIQVGTTEELIALLRSRRIPRPCLLSHPNRWARTRRELVIESAKDHAINVAKRGLVAVS